MLVKKCFISLDGYPDYKYVTNFNQYFIVKQLDATRPTKLYYSVSAEFTQICGHYQDHGLTGHLLFKKAYNI